MPIDSRLLTNIVPLHVQAVVRVAQIADRIAQREQLLGDQRTLSGGRIARRELGIGGIVLHDRMRISAGNQFIERY